MMKNRGCTGQDTSWNLSCPLSVRIHVSWFGPNWWPTERCLITWNMSQCVKGSSTIKTFVSLLLQNVPMASVTEGFLNFWKFQWAMFGAIIRKWKKGYFTVNRPGLPDKVSDRGGRRKKSFSRVKGHLWSASERTTEDSITEGKSMLR